MRKMVLIPIDFMKIFYFDSNTETNVTPESPLEMEYTECLQLFNKLRNECSFIGVLLPLNRALQLYREPEALIWMEILDRQERSLEGANVNIPIAEAALEAAFKGQDIKESLKGNFLVWEKQTLPPK